MSLSPSLEPARRHALTAYFVGTFAMTWLLQLPVVLAQRGWLDASPEALMPIAALGIFGPLAMGTWLTHRESGGTGVRALYRRLGSLGGRHGAKWALAGMLLPGLVLSTTLLGMTALGRQGAWQYFAGPPQLVVAVIVSIAEEVGWRGYALPRMEQRFGPFAAGASLGVVWALWHIPMMLAVGVGLEWVPAMLLFYVGGSLFFSRIHHETGGSLLAAVLTHIGAHLNNAHAAMPTDALPFLVAMLTYGLLGWSTMRHTVSMAPPTPRVAPLLT